jgi:hypothetical protein
VVQLHRERGAIRATGAELFVIGNGTPNFVAGFREQTGWQGPIYTDPSLAVYRAAGLKRSVMRTLDPRQLGSTIRAFARGARQGRKQGDTWQQGGVLVVAPGGDVMWHHASERADDNATAAQIVAALTTTHA